MSNARWSFTKVVVADLEAQLSFYREVFGLEEAHRIKGGFDGDSFEEVFFASEQLSPVLGFIRYLDRAPSPVGETVIGLATPDIGSAFERGKSSGGKVVREPMSSDQTHGFTIGLLEDPEGHVIEVLEVDA